MLKCEVIIDPNGEERVVIYAKENGPIVEEIMRLAGRTDGELFGYDGSEIIKLDPRDIHYVSVINNKIFANIEKMERFDTSISGTLKIRFKNGDVDYVSRRQLRAVKERIGI